MPQKFRTISVTETVFNKLQELRMKQVRQEWYAKWPSLSDIINDMIKVYENHRKDSQKR